MHKSLIFILLVPITFYTRFLNLNWDQDYGFHPDENNLWGASQRVKLFSQLDPDFYAYGGVPIYLYSFTHDKLVARGMSAALQVGIVFLLFVVGQEIGGPAVGIFSALIGVVSAGLIQAAHYLTVESLLGFFGLTILWGLLRFKKSGNYHWFILALLGLGLGIGTKVSFAVFALPFIVVLTPVFKKGGILLKRIIALWSGVILVGGVFFLTNPYIVSRWQQVRGTLRYESDVAMGKSRVFYTRQFEGTTPGVYQAIHVFPYITSWLFLPLACIGLVRARKHPLVLLLLVAAILSFVPMWVKWTRYVVQVLPVFVLLAGDGLAWVWKQKKWGKLLSLSVAFSFLPQFAGMVRVYSSIDTRIQAAQWAQTQIPAGAPIFTEGMEIGIVPFNPAHGTSITLFNFYELDEDLTGAKQRELQQLIGKSTYFISPSMRVSRHVLSRPDRFPLAAAFYRTLIDRPGPFALIKSFSTMHQPETEETFEVFDHPEVNIYKRI